MFKKIGLTVLVLGLMVSFAYAGGVTDENNGNKGDIFVSTGENHGANSVGEWVDSSFLKGKKGDTGATGEQGIKGDKGETGIQGIQGVAGQDGTNGINGINGQDGAKGDKGDTGAQGIQGVKGNKGAKGNKGDKGTNGVDGKDGINGADGANGIDGAKGDKGDIGLTGDKGDAGKDVDPTTVTNLQNTDVQLQDNINTESTARTNANTTLNNRIDDTNNRVSKLEDTQGIVGAEVRVYDSKKWTVTTFVDYTTTRRTVDRAGVRFTYKLGTSYEERRANELEARLNKLEGVQNTKEREDSVQYYTTANGMGIKSSF